MELQDNLDTFKREGIAILAVSYDSPAVLKAFGDKHAISYPLLSDIDSQAISETGIFNRHIPKGHKWYGTPYPGWYMVDKDGRVVEKHFYPQHVKRESVNDVLQEVFHVHDVHLGDIAVATTPDLAAKAYFASPTLRNNQVTTLTVEVSPVERLHVNGPDLPEAYTNLELTVDGGDSLTVDSLAFPQTEDLHLEVLNETLPVYTKPFEIKARCVGIKRGEGESITVNVTLRYQACDELECYLPQTVSFPLTLQVLPHAATAE